MASQEPVQEPIRTKIFICYSHKDDKWLRRLKVHLRPLVREQEISAWDDTAIAPGAAWREEIEAAIRTAHVAIILVSADFFASDFIATTELPAILLAAKTKGVNIIPVVISASGFHRHPILSQFQAVNDPQKPLIKLRSPEREDIWVNVVKAVKNSLNIPDEIIREPASEHASKPRINDNTPKTDSQLGVAATAQSQERSYSEKHMGTEENQNHGSESMAQPANRLGILGAALKSPKAGWVFFTITAVLALFLIIQLVTKNRDPLGVEGTTWTYTTDLGENAEGPYRKLRGTNFFIDFDGYSYTMSGSREFAIAKVDKNDNWQKYEPPIPIKISRVSFSLYPPTFYFYFEVQGIKESDEGKGFVELPIDHSNKSKMVGTVYYLHNTKDEKTKDEKKTWSKATITFEKQ